MIDFSQLDPVIHERGRLAIVTLLASRPRPWAFAELRDELGLSDGNLITHLRTLEAAGFARSTKESGPGRPHTLYSLTPAGQSAFRRYLDVLGRLVESSRPRRKK